MNLSDDSTGALTGLPSLDTADGSRSERVYSKDDASWILSNAFMVLTMQTGFGLLEAGCVSTKNIVNIMVKNVVDVTLGGIAYWSFGYGLSFGRPSNWFCGLGDFFATNENDDEIGPFYTKYLFQFTCAASATTIVSGAVTERMKLTAYMVLSILNTFIYCLPASWAWNHIGFLHTLGFFDFAGSCVVHLTGGASALAGAWMIGPRLGRFGDNDRYRMSSPVTALTGTFMLWWAWMGFNCGSTTGIDGHLWKIAAKVGINTMNGSVGGGLVALALSAWRSGGKCHDIGYLISGILGGLVSVTAGCAVISPFEALLLGAAGASAAIGTGHLIGTQYIRVDDPVGAFPVHFGAGLVGTVGVGLFGRDDFDLLKGNNGLLHGGGVYLLGVQVFGAVIMALWSAGMTVVLFMLMEVTIGVRVPAEEEILGADWVEHHIRSTNFADKLERALMELNCEGHIDDVIKALLLELYASSGHTVKTSPHVRNIVGGQASVAADGGSHQQASSERQSQVERKISVMCSVGAGASGGQIMDASAAMLAIADRVQAAAAGQGVEPNATGSSFAAASSGMSYLMEAGQELPGQLEAAIEEGKRKASIRKASIRKSSVLRLKTVSRRRVGGETSIGSSQSQSKY